MFILYLLCLALAVHHRNRNTYIYYKVLTSLTFVLVGGTYGYHKQDWEMFPVLVGFLIGDIMLATKLKRHFIYGMGGFLAADVWLIFYLYQYKELMLWDFVLSVLIIIFVFVISKSPRMHLGHYKKPMYLYGAILSLAVSNSIGCFLLYGTERYFMLSVGMGLYFISDFLLMFQYFYTTKHTDQLKILKMLTYFMGAYLIAASMGR